MNELTCRDVVAFLADYLDGDLDPRARDVFETHLAVCDACVVYLRQYEQTVRLGQSAFDDPDALAASRVPDELIRAILAARRFPG